MDVVRRAEDRSWPSRSAPSRRLPTAPARSRLQVVEAALAVRLLDRSSPRHTKPVLAAALRRTVPDPILDRTAKGEFSAEVYAGVRRHERELLELADGMLLARLGLVP